MKKVYLIQEPHPGINILPAREYGELMPPILERLQQVMFNGRAVTRDLWTRLKHYEEGDYILAVGDFVAVGLAIALAARASGGRVNILKWDRQEGEYYSVSIDLSEVN